MYRILIADDEYWTREKIHNMIKWSEYDLMFLKPAENGEEALDRIDIDHPDILITDINMPFLNGIELIQAVHQKSPNIIIIVLSGYDNFEYVRNALIAGAVDYLLKPITEAELINVLSRALEELAQQKIKTEQECEKQIQLLRASSLLQDREFSALIKNESPIDAPNIAMNLNMESAEYRLVLIKIHNLSAISKEFDYDMSMLSYHLKKVIRKSIDSKKFIIFNYIYRPNEFLFLSDLKKEKFVVLLQKLLIDFEQETSSTITIAVSKMAYSMNEIREVYNMTVSLQMLRPFVNRSMLLIEPQNTQILEQNSIRHKVGNVEENTLKILLQSGNKSSIRSMIQEKIGLKNAETEQWTYFEVKQVLKRIVSVLTADCIGIESSIRLAELEDLSDVLDKTLDLLDLEVVFQILDEMIDVCIGAHRMKISETISGIVEQIAQYIEENYHEEFSLNTLAKRFFVDSSYLSKAFRQQKGENLMSYIARQKVIKAKQFIEEGNVSLMEISFLVGYDDYNYFSRVFKKITGMSPREYKISVNSAEKRNIV